jgi:hypothetical protein
MNSMHGVAGVEYATPQLVSFWGIAIALPPPPANRTSHHDCRIPR